MLDLWNSMSRLAEAYEHLLFDGELQSRFVHHLAHVASEQWLSVELAMLVNARGEDFGLEGWTAVAEKQRVDVTLIPPGTDARAKLPERSINLELKLVGTDWWRTIWPEVRAELTGKSPKKPRAHFAVCFLTNAICDGMSARRAATTSLYDDFESSVPTQPGEFVPISGEEVFICCEARVNRNLLGRGQFISVGQTVTGLEYAFFGLRKQLALGDGWVNRFWAIKRAIKRDRSGTGQIFVADLVVWRCDCATGYRRLINISTSACRGN